MTLSLLSLETHVLGIQGNLHENLCPKWPEKSKTFQVVGLQGG